ncbi:MAG: diguanylate cyclase, partial [Synergistaceae bacterium]|jgi:diguanylate cyclase (GGDEF)-like protein|nr:diguanylate cyclase [Synergistaceae bacterium]
VEKISFVSDHDALTGLLNRRVCEETIEFLDRQEYLPLGIIYADLNCLKLANDAFGHHEGDALLKTAAGILKENAGAGGNAYRHGGDEFIVLLKNTSEAEVEGCANRINRACENWKGAGLISPSMALGYAVKLYNDQKLDDIIKKAEDTMYANKLRNGGQTRMRILGALEGRLNGMMEGAMGERSRRMKMWGEWALENMDIDCEPYLLKMLCRYHDVGLLASSEEIAAVSADPRGENVANPMQHMAIGYRIARCTAEIASVADLILSHHEWWDGMGYPNQQSGRDIPAASRLVSIFDSLEGMLCLPPKSERLSPEGALASLEACAGRQFDPNMVERVVALIRQDPPKFMTDVRC